MGSALRAMLLGDANDLLDETGRPVGEIRASEAVRRSCPTQYKLCPYRGSRQRSTRLLNASALDPLLSEWPVPLHVLGQVRSWHGLRPMQETSLLDLCRVSHTVLCLPAWMAFRSASRSIPARVAAAHKMCQGLFGLCKNLLIERVAFGEDHRSTRVGVRELYRYAERSGALLSRTGIEACAGPPELIGQALRTLVTGAIDGGLSDDMLDFDGRPLLDYAAACADMTLWVIVTSIAQRSAAWPADQRAAATLFQRLSDPVTGPVPDMPQEVREAYAHGALALYSDDATRALLRGLLTTCSALEFERSALRIFDHLQGRVMVALERPPHPPDSAAPLVGNAFCHHLVDSLRSESHV